LESTDAVEDAVIILFKPTFKLKLSVEYDVKTDRALITSKLTLATFTILILLIAKYE
jgi:hypothetical protein